MITTQELVKKIRLHVLDMTSRGGSSHIASAFSIADLLAVLYADYLTYDPKNPSWEKRDRFILSKGHAGAAVYATLAECGFFPIEKLKSHYQDGSDLSGHVSHKNIPGVEVSTGSLGHGLSIGAGMALVAKKDRKNHKVVVVMSDGECDEGSNWEAIMFSGFHKLNHLIAIVDYNKYQSLKSTYETLDLEPFRDKWESFNWEVLEVNGHDHVDIKKALNTIPISDKPTCIIAHTVKGRGVSFMEEDKVLWHYRTAKGEEYEKAKAELLGGSL